MTKEQAHKALDDLMTGYDHPPMLEKEFKLRHRLIDEYFNKKEKLDMVKNEVEQEAMDGSPCVAKKTLIDLDTEGKFRSHDPRYGSSNLIAGDNVIYIKFQCGPISEVGVNGCAIEDVIDVLVNRLKGFQLGQYKCPENQAAIDSLLEAKDALSIRTSKRQKQGVEGTSKAHNKS